MPVLSHFFDGMYCANGSTVAVPCTGDPPDTNGAVGPNDYVQMVNSGIAVFSKTGTVLMSPTYTDALWYGYPTADGNDCASEGLNKGWGDGIVLYDRAADRFVVSQFDITNYANNSNSSTGPSYECVAVSQTGDPIGAYYLYDFKYNYAINDYPKLATWSDGYYITMNMFNAPGTYEGTEFCAYDRASMLVGHAATQQCFTESQTGVAFGSLPADVDSGLAPPAGSPEFFATLGTSTSLYLWKFHTDWANTANTTLTGPISVTVQSYAWACGTSGTCIPQPSPGNQLDSLGDRLMFRMSYRNFGDHQSLLLSHTVTAASSTGVRWYELRIAPDFTVSLYQEGTFAPPDGSYRWMGSAAMDASGDIALGYSLSSASIYPSIAITGRLASDPLGTMPQGEETVYSGGGVESGSFNGGQKATRWGDYSDMTVDPSDDCTFWYTNEYYAQNGIFTWATRIVAFKFPSCSQPTVTVKVDASGTYGSAPNLTGLAASNPAISYDPSSAAPNVTGTLTCSTTATSSSPVSASPYPVSNCSGLADAGATISYDYVHSGYVVQAEPLTVTAANKTGSYRAPLPAFTYTANGFVNGDTSSSLTTQPACHTTATHDASGLDISPAGTYPITCSGAADPNYAIGYLPGIFTVSLAADKLAYTGPKSVKHKSKAVFSAKLTSLTGQAIVGRRVTMTLRKQSCSGSTNAGGTATCTIQHISDSPGTYTLAMKFAGDPKGPSYDYAPAGARKTIKVT